jgi:hypothetical protein
MVAIFPRVPHYARAEARAAWKLLSRRGLENGPDPTEHQLNDPAFVDRLLKAARELPGEEDWKALRGIKASLEAATFEAAARSQAYCRRVLESHRDATGGAAPTEEQLRTLESLEEMLGVVAPRECRQSWRAWESFVRSRLPDDIEEICVEVEAALQKRIDRESLGGRVYALGRWLALKRDSGATKSARAREMLLAGTDPLEVADALGMTDAEVYALSNAIEGEGTELSWS